MRITGYKPMTEKEHDYLLIHGLLQKYEIPTTSIDEFLDMLRGNLAPPPGKINLAVARLQYDMLLPFCITCDNSPDYHLRLAELPENTIELFIETK